MRALLKRLQPAHVIAAVLATDGVVHVYWATGATWPAGDTRSLSLALLAMEVPFRPPLLLSLATTLFAGAGLVLVRARLRSHRSGALGPVGRLAQLATSTFTAGVLVRGLLGYGWICTPGAVPTSFYWLNLAFYTPLCTLLFTLGVRALRTPADGRSADPDSVGSEDTLQVASPRPVSTLVQGFGRGS